ncbi:MAG: arylesterase [Salinarimonadaceae bacterium]|nr:MAG: arylesterase [Salinarimonadaceae bacterium]
MSRQSGLFRRLPLLVLALALAAVAAPRSGGVAQAGEALTIVALGDSLTAGYGLPASESFPSRLEAALRERGHHVKVINAGVSGDTASGGRDRLDWSVPDEADGVIVALGANDMLRGFDPGLTEQALEAIVARLKERGMGVLLAGMMAGRNLGPQYVERFDAIYPDLAERHGVALYPFFLDGVAGEEAYNLDDGIHPNAEGVAIMVERMLPTVEAFIESLSAS